MLIGCGNKETQKTQRLDLSEIAAEFTPSIEDNWRWAREVPGGRHAVKLGPIKDGAVLRLGILDRPGADGAVRAEVRAGGDGLQDLETGADRLWDDYRFELPPESAGKICEIVFESRHSFYLGPVALNDVNARNDAKPNVLVFLIDTLRKDRLGCYGNSRRLSPHLDAFAEESVVFTELMPPASWTRPSVGSLITSVYPHIHQANDTFNTLRRDLPRWTEPFRDAGYRCAAVHSNTHLLPVIEFGYGYDTYDYIEGDEKDADVDDALVVDTAIKRLDFNRDTPWFLYVHAMGPHDPYDPPEPYRSQFLSSESETDERQESRDLYDGEVAYTDAQFGRMMDALKERNLYDNTIVVVLSDHGEEFWEHGQLGHAKSLYEEVLRVPLMIKLPNDRHGGARRDGLVEMIDVAPTLHDLAGLESPESFLGKSFRDMLERGGSFKSHGFAFHSNLDERLRAAKGNGYKLIENSKKETKAWYDLNADPFEQQALDAAPNGAAMLESALRQATVVGNSGLHILVTSPYDSGRRVEGCVAGIQSNDFEVLHPQGRSEIREEDDRLLLRFNFNTSMRDSFRADYGDQDTARFRSELPIDTNVHVVFTMDGEPMPPDRIHIGADRHNPSSNEVSFRCGDILDLPANYSPELLPEQTAVYIWYSPSPSRVTNEDLTEEHREDLRALGYLD